MQISLDDIYPPRDVYAKCGSRSVIFEKEKRGEFPRRYYLDAEASRPRKPFWLKRDVDKWLQDRIDKAEEARARAGLTGARLVEARHLKAAA
jgi:predicted DNA-binding transcriptional regulator AlpA